MINLLKKYFQNPYPKCQAVTGRVLGVRPGLLMSSTGFTGSKFYLWVSAVVVARDFIMQAL